MRPATRKLLSLLLAALLVAGQWAGQLHALSHARHDLAVALASLGDTPAGRPQAPLPLNHSADLCVAFHALDGVAVATAGPAVDIAPLQFFHAVRGCVLRAADPLPFSSRAPPLLS